MMTDAQLELLTLVVLVKDNPDLGALVRGMRRLFVRYAVEAALAEAERALDDCQRQLERSSEDARLRLLEYARASMKGLMVVEDLIAADWTAGTEFTVAIRCTNAFSEGDMHGHITVPFPMWAKSACLLVRELESACSRAQDRCMSIKASLDRLAMGEASDAIVLEDHHRRLLEDAFSLIDPIHIPLVAGSPAGASEPGAAGEAQ